MIALHPLQESAISDLSGRSGRNLRERTFIQPEMEMFYWKMFDVFHYETERVCEKSSYAKPGLSFSVAQEAQSIPTKARAATIRCLVVHLLLFIKLIHANPPTVLLRSFPGSLGI